jgi:hypothetical protein
MPQVKFEEVAYGEAEVHHPLLCIEFIFSLWHTCNPVITVLLHLVFIP